MPVIFSLTDITCWSLGHIWPLPGNTTTGNCRWLGAILKLRLARTRNFAAVAAIIITKILLYTTSRESTQLHIVVWQLPFDWMTSHYSYTSSMQGLSMNIITVCSIISKQQVLGRNWRHYKGTTKLVGNVNIKSIFQWILRSANIFSLRDQSPIQLSSFGKEKLSPIAKFILCKGLHSVVKDYTTN